MTGSEEQPDLRVLAMVPSIYGVSPGERFRIEQWEPRLRDEGITITYAPFESTRLHEMLHTPGHVLAKSREIGRALVRRAQDIPTVHNFDLVYLYREAALVGPAVFERWIARSGRPFVFDFDDAVFLTYRSPANGMLMRLKMPGKTATTCRLANHVMVGNSYLASYANRFNPRVTIVPTAIDLTRHVPHRTTADEGKPVIGWTGSHSTLQHLDIVRPALQALAATRPFTLRVVGTSSYSVPGVDVDARPWAEQTEIADLLGIDIGIMPLPDDPWTRGKCALKALQYMALEIPAVSSPVGVTTEFVRDGENGFLARNEEEWVDRVTRLLDSAALRQRLGKAGRVTVAEQFDGAIHAGRVADIFRSVVRPMARPGRS